MSRLGKAVTSLSTLSVSASTFVERVFVSVVISPICLANMEFCSVDFVTNSAIAASMTMDIAMKRQGRRDFQRSTCSTSNRYHNDPSQSHGGFDQDEFYWKRAIINEYATSPKGDSNY